MIKIKENVSLKKYSNFKIGGNAKYFISVKSVEELISVLTKWKEISDKFSKEEQNVFVLGGGTNLLISDDGFNGLVIYNNIKFIDENNNLITVGAGVLVKDLLNFCIENSLSGLQWAGGLPGTVGGAIRGNAGAFAGEIKDSVVEADSLDINTLTIKKRKNKDCNFDYRNSIFKINPSEIIISAVFKLEKGDKKKIGEEIEEKIIYRRNRHPLEYPNIGSIFKNIPLPNVPREIAEEFKNSIKTDPFPVLPTAKLIAVSNLKGERVGDAQVSEKHPNFIVNLGNAKSEDVRELIEKVKIIIKDKFGIELEEEITILG